MAVTKGQGNPKWSKDETLLALNLYFQFDSKIPGKKNQKVIELSKLLNKLPIHSLELRKKNFRNPDGVVFKLQNIRNVATGKGLDNVSKMDELTWNEFGNNPKLVLEISNGIEQGLPSIPDIEELASTIPDERTFSEGKIYTAIHQKRERSPKIRKLVLKQRTKLGALSCDICGTQNQWTPTIKEDSIFECHHIEPLSFREVRQTTVKDLALLCANCHRAIHSYISSLGDWVRPEELKKKV